MRRSIEGHGSHATIHGIENERRMFWPAPARRGSWMNNFYAVLLGIVEGFSEFLPISSTGHLKLTESLLGIHDTENEFFTSFKIIIQLGAILSVPALYGRSLLVNPRVLQRLLVSFVPTGLIGLLYYQFVKELLKSDVVVLWSLGIGGICLIVFELLHCEPKSDNDLIETITYPQCMIIGLCQAMAMVPGVSRSAATIIGGMALGLPRKTIVEFSFLLALPTMAAATGLELLKHADTFALEQIQFLALGFVVSFLVALASIKFLLAYVQHYTFIPFGVYRILIALVLGWVLFGS
jgi:undecaprenyl-diphosphatase